MERAVVLVSGGLNSAVAAAVAREQYATVLLHVGWGHRAADRERAAFNELVAHYRAEDARLVDLSGLATFGGNSRANRKLAIEDADTLGEAVPSTFAMGLLPTMLSVATVCAAGVKARRIILGISEDHGTPGPRISDLYPDHSRSFVQAYNLMLQYARPADREMLVEAPLIGLTRVEVIRLGTRMGVPFEKTWSCYSREDRPCGRCRACVNRAVGFIRAGLADPLFLQPAATAD